MAEPVLSFILATDTYATIRPVVERLRRQTMRDRIELVLAAPPGAVDEVLACREEFAGVRVVEDPVAGLAPARAAAVRAASAEWVFIGETHSYPHPEMAENLCRRASEDWSVIVPAFGNANPVGVWSWAGFLSDYGPWEQGRTDGETTRIPIYNAAFRRRALLDLGDRLAPALHHGDELPLALRGAGHKACFEPAARIDHVNVASPWHWAKERFAAGVLIAGSRASRWSFARRALYVVASPLIAVVLFGRVLPGAWRAIRAQRLPITTVFWIAVGMMVKAVGELFGYAGAPAESWDQIMHEYEVHKLAYARRNGC